MMYGFTTSRANNDRIIIVMKIIKKRPPVFLSHVYRHINQQQTYFWISTRAKTQVLVISFICLSVIQ